MQCKVKMFFSFSKTIQFFVDYTVGPSYYEENLQNIERYPLENILKANISINFSCQGEAVGKADFEICIGLKNKPRVISQTEFGIM